MAMWPLVKNLFFITSLAVFLLYFLKISLFYCYILHFIFCCLFFCYLFDAVRYLLRKVDAD